MTGNKRRVFVAAAIACVGALAPAIASAVPAVPQGPSVTFQADPGEFCAFGLEFTFVGAQAEHDTGHGDIIFTGPVAVTVTNLASHATQSYNVSGPTFLSADGLMTLTGPAIIGQPASRNIGPAFLIL